jgi:predicted nucleic acid-binding protein
MSDRFFVDTNLLVYAYDQATGGKHNLVVKLFRDLLAAGTGVLSTQVLQELAVSLRRKVAAPLSSSEVRKILSELQQDWEIFVNAPETILDALEIEERFRISFWDALILSAAQTSSATILYSEDLNHGQRYGDVRVVNPFKV